MAFRTQKISQMTPKGADLEATDLIEVSTIESGSYVTRSITGQELIDAIPPTTIEWGDIGGTLSDQTDLNTALNAKVPTSRTLTINGVTQDLSADRTFNISTGITIGSTAIASGTVGRVLFQGTGNVVQQSSSLTYDDTLKTFTLIGPISSVIQHTALTNYNGLGGLQLNVADGTERGIFKLNPTSGEVRIGATGSGYFTTFYAQGVEAMRIFASTRNVSIGTTTDAGFRLDVNGTARVKGGNNNSLIIDNDGSQYTSALIRHNGNSRMQFTWDSSANSGYIGSFNTSATTLQLRAGIGSTFMILHGTGNVGINTTTDAGFRLDVNGTARVSGNATINGQLTTTTAFPTIRAHSANTTDSAGFQCATNNGSGNNASFLTYSASVGFGLGGNAGFGSSTSIIIFGNSSANSGGTTAIRLRPGGFDTPADALIAYQNSVSIGTTNIPVASAVLDVVSTTKGFLPPRMTTTQKNAIASPAAGLMVYDTTLNVISYYNGSMWI